MPKRIPLAILTAFSLFDFYGSAGWAEGGPIPHTMSVISVCIVTPLMAIWGIVIAVRDLRRKPMNASDANTFV
jgi:hypothetical protein